MPARTQDHHAVLGLTSDASDDAIRVAYKKLALQWHPDRHLVGKEHAAQMFIEVNQAYHALMDGKESTHSSSTETSSTTSTPASSADATHSDTHTKSTRASSRPPSASSNSSKRSSPQSSTSSSAPRDGHSEKTSKPSAQSRTRSSSSHSSSSSDDLKPSSHPRRAKPNSYRNQSSSDRMKRGRKSSKSHDHLRDPPAPDDTAPTSNHSRSSEGLGGSARSKSSEKTTHSSSASRETKHDRPERTKASHTGTGRPRRSKPAVPPSSERSHKSTKPGLADEFIHKLSKGAQKGKEPPDNLPHDQDAIPYGSPLRAINTPRGASKEWLFPLPLTLDELYHGTKYRFLVTRQLLSHRTEEVEMSINIPPGMRSGTRIICPRSGHQRKDGTLQDVVFLVEEVPDERFSRVKDDLFMDVCIPWADPLADQGGEICIQGIDGKEITFALPYPIYDKATEGQVLVKGAGMPIRDGRKTVGRGDMIVKWRVVFTPHHSKWQNLKKALHLNV